MVNDNLSNGEPEGSAIQEPKIETKLARSGMESEPDFGATTPHTPAIHMSVNFGAPDLETAAKVGRRQVPGYMYGRLADPTGDVLANHLAMLEEAEDALLFGSGMAAISASILANAQAGSHLLVSESLYSGSRTFLDKILPRFDISVTYFDPTLPAVELGAIKQQDTRIIFIEPITNPLCSVTNVADYAEFARDEELALLVDNTLTPPPLFKPIKHGAHLSIHSVTKYLNGHGDVLAGAVIGSKAEINRVRPFMIALGGCLAPMGSYLVMRGMRTLDLRMRRASSNALRLAEWLLEHPAVSQVFYPGLEGHPQFDLALQQFEEGPPGGVLSFIHKDGEEGAKRFIEKLKMISFAASLGEPHTLVEYPPINQYGHLTRDEKRKIGIVDGLIRLAVGLEHTDDLIADCEQALAV